MTKARMATPIMVWTFLTLAAMAYGSTGSGWQKLDENTETSFYFDGSKVEKLPGGVVRITARVVYSDKGKEDALDVLEPATLYAHLAESWYTYDLDCSAHKSKLETVTHLADDGSRIKTVDLAPVTAWETISPNERLELIRELACSP